MATQQLWIERKLETCGVARVRVGVAVAVALISVAAQRGWLGSNRVLSAQLLATLLTLAMSPLLLFYSLPRHPVVVLFLAALTCLAILPCLLVLLHELAFGHVRADAQWYDALWRIYAILALWMLFAILNEAKFKPLWRAFAASRVTAHDTDAQPQNTVQARAAAMKRVQRDAKLKQLKDRVDTAIKQKKTAEAAIAAFDMTTVKARQNLVETRRMVDEARSRLAACDIGDTETKESAQAELDKALLLADCAADHERGLDAQKNAYELMQMQAMDQLKELREAWKHASDLNNYGFFR